MLLTGIRGERSQCGIAGPHTGPLGLYPWIQPGVPTGIPDGMSTAHSPRNGGCTKSRRTFK
jgi:hypothetical protein